MALQLKNGETLLFVGDSITDCGRRGAERPLGNGYVKLFADFAAIREPRKAITVLNKGIGGNTVVDLKQRWTDDVLRHAPDWLSIKIGINDLHRTLKNPGSDVAVAPDLFRSVYEEILTRTQSALPNVNLLLIDPFYISNETASTSFRKSVLDLLPAYLSVVQEMSRKFKTRRLKTQSIFQNLLKTHEPDFFAPEPVHPYTVGHLVIAEAVFDTLSR